MFIKQLLNLLMPDFKFYLGGGGSSSSGPSSMQTTSGVLAPYAAQYGQQLLGQVSALTSQGYTPYQSGQALPNGQVAGFSNLQNESFNSAGNMGVAPQIGAGSTMAAQAGMGSMNTAGNALNYGQQGANYGAQGANIGTMGGGMYGGMGANYGSQAANMAGNAQGYGNLGAQEGLSYGQNATNPGAVQAYMNPYLQASLAPQEQLLAQQQGQQQAVNQAQATQAGAFGGSRMGVQNALQNQANQLAMSNLIGQGYNNAFNTANTNMQTAANLGMQGAQAGISGLNAANTEYQTGISGAQAGLQGVGQQLAGTAQGISGAQAGLQGVAGAQSGYSGANTAATNLGNLGNTQYTQQVGNINLQNQLGAQQQQYQQNLDTTAYQNYLNQMQLPYQNASFFLNAVNGLPTSGSTTSIYSNPSPISVAAGLGTAALGASKLAKKGGLMKEKKMAAGGLAALAVAKMA